MSGKRFVDSIDIQVAPDSDVDEIIDAIKNFLARRYKLKGGKDDAFNVRNEMQWRQAWSDMSNTMGSLLAVVAVISLIVGGIGIMNIMLVTVTERTREIGLRKAVGARGSDILIQFLSEASAISLTGGLIGIALGGAIAFGMAKILQWTVIVTPFSILLSFGFSAGVGIVFGFWPARRASKLAPAEALRSD
jgi:ABC-type antimicrobial peptide transport system permease subunit